MAEGKGRRSEVPRSSHSLWTPAANRPDPMALLEESNRSRLQNLVPLRYGRMLISPFSFLRGSPIVMAHDLAQTPVSGIQVQACGDAHLANFGVYASPERNLLFDLNVMGKNLTFTADAGIGTGAKALGVSLTGGLLTAQSQGDSYLFNVNGDASMRP